MPKNGVMHFLSLHKQKLIMPPPRAGYKPALFLKIVVHNKSVTASSSIKAAASEVCLILF